MKFEYIDKQQSRGVNIARVSDRKETPRRTLEDAPDVILQIYKAYNNDSYFRQACDKQRDLIFS